MDDKEDSDLITGYQKVLKLLTLHMQHCELLKDEVSDVEEFKD